jgi:hypothetical protein
MSIRASGTKTSADPWRIPRRHDGAVRREESLKQV